MPPGGIWGASARAVSGRLGWARGVVPRVGAGWACVGEDTRRSSRAAADRPAGATTRSGRGALAVLVVLVLVVLGGATGLALGEELRERGAGGERGGEEQRVLGGSAPAVARGQAAGGERGQVHGRAAPVVAGDAHGARHVELELRGWRARDSGDRP